MSPIRLPDPFVRWFHNAMFTIRGIWPWTRFVVYSPAEIIVGLGGPFRCDGPLRRPVNDNRRRP